MSDDKKDTAAVRDYHSFSEIRLFEECGWHHKVRYVDGVNLSTRSVHTEFGTALHFFSEHIVRGLDKSVETLDKIERDWHKNKFEEVELWKQHASQIMSEIPDFLSKQFPGWTLFGSEIELREPIPNSEKFFKGYVDLAIEVVKTSRGKDKRKIILLDWKTAGDKGWSFKKKTDPLMQLQLQLYKKFISEKFQIPIKDIQCGFILLKRGAKPGKCCELITISAGPKAIQKAEKKMQKLTYALANQKFYKNRGSCTYCELKNSDHCKGYGPSKQA